MTRGSPSCYGVGGQRRVSVRPCARPDTRLRTLPLARPKRPVDLRHHRPQRLLGADQPHHSEPG